MATTSVESATSHGNLRLAKKDPEIARSASASDRFTVKFKLEGTDLRQLENELARRVARIGVARVSRTGMTMSLYEVEKGRESEVFHEMQGAIDDVNSVRKAAWTNAQHRRSATEAAEAVSEVQLQDVREGFRAARRPD